MMCVGHPLGIYEPRFNFNKMLHESTCCQADVLKQCRIELVGFSHGNIEDGSRYVSPIIYFYRDETSSKQTLVLSVIPRYYCKLNDVKLQRPV